MITPEIRFAAYDYVRAMPNGAERHAATLPSQVESFPASYTPEFVERACALLRRMAYGPRDDSLRADIVQYHNDLEAWRRDE